MIVMVAEKEDRGRKGRRGIKSSVDTEFFGNENIRIVLEVN